MRFESKIKRENGDKVTIVVICQIEYSATNTSNLFYIDDVKLIPKGKRKEISVYENIRQSYSFRGLEGNERYTARMTEFLKHVSLKEMNEALIIAWESIKPQPLQFGIIKE